MPRLPWFAWAIVAFIVLNVIFQRGISLFPLIMIGFVLASVAGSAQRRSRRQVPQPPHQPHQTHDQPLGQPYGHPSSQPPGHPYGQGQTYGHPSDQSHTDPYGQPQMPGQSQTPGQPQRPGQPPMPGQPSTPTAEPMPTIDVPRYPGTPSSSSSSSLGTDPVVSFAQLQLGQAGRDLEQVATSGDDADVEQALRRMQSTLAQIRPSLEGMGSPQARTLRASLDGLGAATTKALAQSPGPGRSALVERIVATCRTAS